MLGAIIGDLIGKVHEAWPIKTTRFRLFHPARRFTDDTESDDGDEPTPIPNR